MGCDGDQRSKEVGGLITRHRQYTVEMDSMRDEACSHLVSSEEQEEQDDEEDESDEHGGCCRDVMPRVKVASGAEALPQIRVSTCVCGVGEGSYKYNFERLDRTTPHPHSPHPRCQLHRST